MELKLRSDAFLDGFHQARSLGIQTKPVVAGPFTFFEAGPLYRSIKSATDFVDDICLPSRYFEAVWRKRRGMDCKLTSRIWSWI